MPARLPKQGSSPHSWPVHRILLLQVPVDCALQTFAQRNPRLPSQEIPCPAGIEGTARLAIRFTVIPFDFAFVSHHSADNRCKVPNADFLPRSKVDRVRRVI